MKKLLLLLLFTITANAQFQTSYPPLAYCDDNNDQFGVFDLSQLSSMILTAVNPNDYNITYHDSFAAAQTNTDIILTPNSYVNIQPAIQTVGIRILNNQTSEISFATVDLRVYPTPIGNTAVLSFCDPNELAFYNLENAIPQITTDPSVIVTFFETLADAQNQSNAINTSNGYIPLVSPGAQTLFARVENTQTGCFAITTLTLNTQNCGDPCPAPTQLTATNISDTSFGVSWSNLGGSMGYIFNRVCIVPIGAMPDDSYSAIVAAMESPTFIFNGLLPNTCYDVYVKKVCDTSGSYSPWSAPLQVCTQDCTISGNCSGALVLKAFIDSNNNGVMDDGESNFNQGNFAYQINDSGTTLFGYPYNGSFMIFDTNPTNSYDLSFEINGALTNYYASNSTQNNITIVPGSGPNYLYFPITVLQAYVDGSSYLYPQNQPRPGFTYNVFVSYKNNGPETIQNGTLTFNKDPNTTIYSVSQTGITSTSNGFTYDFTNLVSNELRAIVVTLQVPTIPTVNLGDFLTNSVSIQINNDVNVTNNSSSLTQMIVGSYDPNDKSESHGGRIVFDDFTSDDYLYYTIRFENTGTADAEFIRVEDVLDADLDENTFEMLTASHTVNTRRAGNQLTWHFYNINLPPTTTNPNDSHGYVHFRIKPKAGYALGDVIPNTASIFFDYNPAIVTNTFNTEFVQSLGTPSFNKETITIYPNPAEAFITISNSNASQSIVVVSIYDISGKQIYFSQTPFLANKTINVSDFAKGLYLLELTAANNQKITKKLIIK